MFEEERVGEVKPAFEHGNGRPFLESGPFAFNGQSADAASIGSVIEVLEEEMPSFSSGHEEGIGEVARRRAGHGERRRTVFADANLEPFLESPKKSVEIPAKSATGTSSRPSAIAVL